MSFLLFKCTCYKTIFGGEIMFYYMHGRDADIGDQLNVKIIKKRRLNKVYGTNCTFGLLRYRLEARKAFFSSIRITSKTRRSKRPLLFNRLMKRSVVPFSTCPTTSSDIKFTNSNFQHCGLASKSIKLYSGLPTFKPRALAFTPEPGAMDVSP